MAGRHFYRYASGRKGFQANKDAAVALRNIPRASRAQRDATERLVNSMVAAGQWDKFVEFYYLGYDGGDHRKGLKGNVATVGSSQPGAPADQDGLSISSGTTAAYKINSGLTTVGITGDDTQSGQIGVGFYYASMTDPGAGNNYNYWGGGDGGTAGALVLNSDNANDRLVLNHYDPFSAARTPNGSSTPHGVAQKLVDYRAVNRDPTTPGDVFDLYLSMDGVAQTPITNSPITRSGLVTYTPSTFYMAGSATGAGSPAGKFTLFYVTDGTHDPDVTRPIIMRFLWELGVSGAYPVTNFTYPMFAGDSITYSASDENYVDYLTYTPSGNIDNQGVGGETISRQFTGAEATGQWAGRGVVDNISTYLNPSPIDIDSAVIGGGINDLSAFEWPVERAKFAVSQILNECYNTAHLNNVALTTVIQKTAAGTTPNREDVDEFNSWLKTTAKQNGCVLFDANAVMQYRDYWYDDPTHPNAAGAGKLAQAFEAAIIDAGTHSIQAPDTSQSTATWDISLRAATQSPAYPGLTITGREAAFASDPGDILVLPASAALPASGKIYAEIKLTAVGGTLYGSHRIGFASAERQTDWNDNIGNGASNPLPAIYMPNRKLIVGGNVYTQPKGPTGNMQTGETVMLAYDSEAGTNGMVWIGWQGQWYTTDSPAVVPDPASGTGGFDLGAFDPTQVYFAASIGHTANYQSMTVEFVDEIHPSRIPDGFTVFSG